MVRILFSLFLFIIHSTLHANENDTPEENSHLIDLRGMPTSIVAGCVNAITGNYSESHVDLQLLGSNPLPFVSSYNSSNQELGTLEYGWDINLIGKVTITHAKDARYSTINHGGSQYNFIGAIEDKINHLDRRSFRFGVTNANHGHLTARENLINLIWSFKNGKHFGRMQLHDNEALEFRYKTILGAEKESFRLATHFLPNRCKISYEPYQIKSMGFSDELLGSYSILNSPDSKENHFRLIKTHDGRSVKYLFKKFDKENSILSEVESQCVPHRDYEYKFISTKNDAPRMVCSKLPDSRFTNIEYFENRDYNIWGRKFSVKGHHDSRFGRVSILKQPTATDTTPIETFSFIYHLEKDKVSHKPIAGWTEVFDAYSNRTNYCFSKEHRLTAIEYFQKGDIFYRKENIKWGDEKKDYTLLKKRSLQDAYGKIWLERSYEYDKYGNSIAENLKGDLTGQNGFETFKQTFKYTDSHQVASEVEGSKEIKYTYYYKTDLIESKLILESSKIRQRVFFDYNDNGALRLEIIDDGNHPNRENLSGVTERLIRKVELTKSLPVGFPEIITELGYDVKSGNDFLLRRTINSYSPEGYLIEQKVYDCNDSFAYSKSWTYNAIGKVATETDPLGQTSIQEYDANGNCILKKVENMEFYTAYSYDFSNRLIREEYIYDDGLRLAKTYTYDLRGNKIVSTDIYGNITRYSYDEFNRLIEVIQPAVVTAEGNLVEPVERMTYDVLNNITSKTDGNGFTTYISCTSMCKPYHIQYPDGTEEKSIYNIDGTLRQMFLPNGSYIRYEYDFQKRNIAEATYSPEGELLAKETRTYRGNHLISETDKKGAVTDFTYDVFGRLTGAKTGEMETRFAYDSLGRKTEVWEKYADGRFRKSISVLDVLDRVIEERVEDVLGNVITKKGYRYDLKGNKTHEIVFSSEGETCKNTKYNDQDQPIKIIHPNGETTVIHHIYDYINEWGQSVACQENVDPVGNRIRHVYATNGKLATEEYYSPTGILVKKLSYRYDLAGNLIRRLEDIIINNEVEDIVITSLEYDSRNREIAIIKAYGRPEQKIFRKELTHFDKLARQIKPDGVVIEYTYDLFGRLIEVQDSLNTVHYLYKYDLNGNILSVIDEIFKTKTTREFDKNNLLISECLDNGLKLSYQHDLLGRIQKFTLPDKSSISYVYDAGHLRSVIREAGSKSFTQSYDFDLSGKISQINLPNENGTIIYEYDKALRLVNVQSNYFKQSISENGYDPNNNILGMIQTDPKGEVALTYAYDSLNQLVSEKGFTNHIYDYDSRHNRTKKDDVLYDNDILSQLVSQGNKSYGYDPNGNRKNVYRPDGKMECEYDSLDRLVTITNEGTQVRYKYDAFNRRMSKVVYTLVNNAWDLSHEERYVYCNDSEIGTVSSDGKIRELMLSANFRPAMIEIDSTVYLPIHDHRGNIVTLIDACSHVTVETYRYSSFGEEEIFDAQGNKQSTAISSWRFSGKRVDSETGWVWGATN
jgi:YD repeat-containing protein